MDITDTEKGEARFGPTSGTDLVAEIEAAARRIRRIVAATPLQHSKRLSRRLGANVLIKREDMQEVRSFKIRGAFNRISSLTPAERERGVVCASSGNHAQGVALSCASLHIRGTVYMPLTTPNQKLERVKQFGGKHVEVALIGESYDDAYQAAQEYCRAQGAVFIHPFNDPLVVAGQGTVGKEIHEALEGDLDVVLVAVGGGGLASGVAGYLKQKSPGLKVIGAQPAGSPSMRDSLAAGHLVSLEQIDPFVDGAAVKRGGELTFELCHRYLDEVRVVPEGQVCTTMIELYQNEGIIAEPAGALAVALLDDVAALVKGKTVVCVLSGGNNDILRYPEIMERSLVHQGRKHYLIIEFTQKPGQLRQFVDRALGPTDDIVRFEYMKKTNKEKGAALVGLELQSRKDLEPLLARMRKIPLNCRLLTSEELLYDYLI